MPATRLHADQSASLRGQVLHRVRHVEPWGIRAENVGFDFGKVMERKRTLIEQFVEDRRKQLVGGISSEVSTS